MVRWCLETERQMKQTDADVAHDMSREACELGSTNSIFFQLLDSRPFWTC